MNKNTSGSLAVLLQILEESLIQKSDILSKLEEKSKEQSLLIANPNITMEALDNNMNAKAALIDQITKLDSGFESMYENIRSQLSAQKEEHKDSIARIQKKIAEVMEKSTSIEAIEARNKIAMEEFFRRQRKELQHKKSVSSVARRYYAAANKIDYVNPQFMDQKK